VFYVSFIRRIILAENVAYFTTYFKTAVKVATITAEYQLRPLHLDLSSVEDVEINIALSDCLEINGVNLHSIM